MSNILILTSGFPPLETYGGPAISLSNLVGGVDNHSFFVIANSFEMNSAIDLIGNNKNKVTDYSENTKIMYLDEDKYNYNFIKSHFINVPNLIYVNSFFNYNQMSIALKISKEYKIPILIAPRGELEQGALWHKPLKYIIKRLYIILFNLNIFKNKKIYFQATSIEEMHSINKFISINSAKIISLDNIPTIYTNKLTHNVKKTDEIHIIFVSRIQIKKNLKYALNCLLKINQGVKVVFDIYGPVENEQYWQECVSLINSMPSNVNVEYKHQLNHNEVINKISEYDLFFLPTMSENFGHAIYEALKANTLILISDQTPWTDINESNSGKAYPLKNSDEFINYIEKIASISDDDLKQLQKNQQNYLNEKIDVENIIREYSLFFSKFEE